jgi:hypothetical protein
MRYFSLYEGQRVNMKRILEMMQTASLVICLNQSCNQSR